MHNILETLYDDATNQRLKERLIQFHNLFQHNSLKAELLEEQLWHVLSKRADDLNSISLNEPISVGWTVGSHAKCIDIYLNIREEEDNISVKSGKLSKNRDIVSLSGSRLQSFLEKNDEENENLINNKNKKKKKVKDINIDTGWPLGGQNIIDHLRESNKTHRILCAPSERTEDNENIYFHYKIQTIDSEHFTYPDQKKWLINGSIVEATLNNGICIKIKSTMSWQIWWEIPQNLFTELGNITIIYNKKSKFQYSV